jgi:hypothetical protein
MAVLSAQELLRRHGIDYVETRKGKFTTKCQNCSDNYLCVEIKKDGVVWFCQSCQNGGGEKFEQGKTGDLGPIKATYDYLDESGKLLFQVLRFEPINGPKEFRQRTGPDQEKWSIKGVRIVPFHLPEVLESIASDQTIFVCEGEKDVLTLQRLGVIATCNPMGAKKWWPEFNKLLRGGDIVICIDNDAAGHEHGRLVAENVIPVAKRVRLLDLAQHWPKIEPSDDISDWIEHGGGTAEALWSMVDRLPTLDQVSKLNGFGKPNGKEQEPPREPMPVPVVFPFPIDEKMIPVRDWVVPGLLMRRHVSVLVAPSGSGKSLLTLQLGIACALHKQWSGWLPRRKFRVLVINSEDDVDEMRRRLAAAARIMVPSKDEQDCLRNNLALVDNADGAVVAKFDAKTKTMIATPLLDQIIATIKQNEIDIVFVDPFAETFEGDENSNSELKWAGVMWRHVARETGAAVCLVHHTKKYATGMAGDVDAARGAGALIGIARIVSTLFPMTTREAEVMGVEDDKRGFYLRYDDAKANLNIKSPFARWFFKQTITLDNKTDELPGDDVGVLIPWKPTGPTVLEDQIIKFFTRIDQGIVDQANAATGEFYSFDPRSSERWVVKFAQEFFEIESEAAAAKLIDCWRGDKRLESVQHRSGKQRKVRGRCISELDPNAPKNRKARAADQPQEAQNAFDYGR